MNDVQIHGNPCEYKITGTNELLDIHYKNSKGIEKTARIRDNVVAGSQGEGTGLYPASGPNYTTQNNNTIILT